MYTKKFSFVLSVLASFAWVPLCPVRAQDAAARPRLETLHSFTYADGNGSQFPLTVGADGALYGVNPFGGLGQANDGGRGTAFKITQGGLFHKLADFYPQNGSYPAGPLLLMPDGSLMGATSEGGKSDTGALFRITPPHRFQTKHEFASVSRYRDNTRGAVPTGALALGPDGAVYGTTETGGAQDQGIVYRWTAARGVEVLHTFAPEAGAPPGDGSGSPIHGLTAGPDGALYGATFSRGYVTSGTVYRIDGSGLFTTVYAFHGQDGSNPLLPVFAADGTLYGTTADGGSAGRGVAYKIAPGGKFTVLHAFTQTDGSPTRLTLGPDGDLYGTTEGDINRNGGTVFRLSPGGHLTTLYSFIPGGGFGGMPGGYAPYGGVTFGPNGDLYGTTFEGGQNGDGTVFRLRLPH